jgi:AraC-like DNA-binding protein
LRLTSRTPAAPLNGAVKLWACEAPELDDALERSLPDGRICLYVNLAEDELRCYDAGQCRRVKGIAIGGARAFAYDIDTREQRHVVGATITPGFFRSFFREPADEIGGGHVALEDLWGRDAPVLRERLLAANDDVARLALLESALRARVLAEPARDRAVDHALACFEDQQQTWSVAAVTKNLGLSSVSFIRRFKEQVGLTPKRYARVRRFQRALSRLQPGARGLAAVAADCGYFDQAHFIHDFRGFAGVSPSAYIAAAGAGNHLRLDG